MVCLLLMVVCAFGCGCDSCISACCVSLRMCCWQSWADCGVVLSVIWHIGLPLLSLVCGDHVITVCLWSIVLTCRHPHSLWALMCGFMFELIHHFSPFGSWFMGCFLTFFLDTGVQCSPYCLLPLSSLYRFLSFSILMMTAKQLISIPSKPVYHQLSVCTVVVTVSSSFQCSMADTVSYCRLHLLFLS